MIEVDDVGIELIRRGWDQGCLLKGTSAQKTWLSLRTNEAQDTHSIHPISTSINTWHLQQELLADEDFLIVISQTCDILRSPRLEPMIEVARAYWTSERNIIHEAGKNSVRRFLIQRRDINIGEIEALIADNTVRIQIEKASLLKISPIAAFKEGDTVTPRRFRRWLAKRYDRPALPDDLVIAVQKPIVKAISKLHETDPLNHVLDGISEILFFPHNETVPYNIDMVFIREERINAPVIDDEGAAKLAGWIGETLRKSRQAELIHWEMLSLKQISVYDYTNAYELPTDQYSLLQDE
jgi:hypothetical protein